MRGFLLGVVVTSLLGGFLMHLWSRYATLDACTALERGLTAAVVASLGTDLREGLGGSGAEADRAGEMFLKPLAEPLIRERVRAWVDGRSWVGCAWTTVRLDFGDAGDVISELRSLTLRF